MSAAWIECTGCGERFEVGPIVRGCPRCRSDGEFSPVEVRYEARPGPVPDDDCPGIWRWRDLLPIGPGEALSLHEGGTPLLPVESPPGGPRLLLKNETQNPTWSWKDRAAAVTVSVARRLGYRGVATISTGNYGSSMAAYAGAAGLDCVVFCHRDAPAIQADLMAAYGARVVRGGDREGQMAALVGGDGGGGWFPAIAYLPLAGYSNPFGIEGYKTIAFEICERSGWAAPDRVFVPAGSGDGIYGIWKGFRELLAGGRIARAPRMVACQAAGADSAHRAFLRGERRSVLVTAVATRALSVGEPLTGDHALRAVYESSGLVLLATDEESATAARDLARRGIALELSSAVALACARKAAAEAVGAEGETWVVLGTGAVTKWPDDLRRPDVR